MNFMEPRLKTLILLVSGFLLMELVFAFLVVSEGDGDLLGAFIKSVVLLFFIGLYVAKIKFTKWIISILLFLYALVCIIAGVESSNWLFYIISVYAVFFIYFIHWHKTLIQESHTITSQAVINYTVEDYPLLIVRYKALLIDGLSLLSIMVLAMIIMGESPYRTNVMISLWIICGFMYEPLLNAFAQTIGQRVMKIKVRRFSDPERRVTLPISFCRSVLKGTLGWLSFITINFDKDHRSIHDILCNTIVLKEK